MDKLKLELLVNKQRLFIKETVAQLSDYRIGFIVEDDQAVFVFRNNKPVHIGGVILDKRQPDKIDYHATVKSILGTFSMASGRVIEVQGIQYSRWGEKGGAGTKLGRIEL
ncbi:hypothetical protein [Salinicola sp. MIT1003]|uniref:hypothetical protein n=1 Tax=Salinicola sp. MIT1003 TaxID=1882734 RepID=UPI0008DE4B2F|nr:hypothetical protein [Salinicola sp. MIT1003]OHZ02992.1 hypothetical protein BC443_14985 [Salinicola sp. MIT1003]